MCSLTVKNFKRTAFIRYLSHVSNAAKDKLDPVQESLLAENCLLVDVKDKLIGKASKKFCHLIHPDGSVPLHRAFSVYVFNNKEEFILQQRASSKITYPGYYTNSCCSHPIADAIGEDEEQDALGIKRAAQRRLNYELGIPIELMPLEKFTYVTRMHYMDIGDGTWGEHEIAYIMFLQGQLDETLSTLDAPLSPWFSLIRRYKLKLWWDNLQNLRQFQDHNKIVTASQCYA